VVTPYGVPIRSTTNIVGVDWSLWDASLATNVSDFETLVDPIYNFLNTTTDRQPMTDKYDDNNLDSGLFKARSVVGGVFARMLTSPSLWSKYSSMDQQKLGAYAGFPTTTVILPDAQETAQTWSYTTTTPASSWYTTSFNSSAWSTGLGGFGTVGTPGIVLNTTWNTADIWLRKTFTMPTTSYPNLEFELFHDEDISVYVNGILAASATGYVTSYVDLPISSAALAVMTPGATITLAVSCENTVGGQGVDVGIVSIHPGTRLGTITGTVTGGKAGETVYLDANNNHVLDSGELSTTTAANGNYYFSDVPSGFYIIRQILPTGYTQITPTNNYGDHVTVSNGSIITNQNFVDKLPVVHTQLTGITIGTAGSYENIGNTISKATDGNLSTFFDGPGPNGNWVGLDLGSTKSVAEISYAPRAGFASRMVGGEFQVSTTANFSSGVTTIYTITAAPPVGSLTTVTFTTPILGRYFRYLSPLNSYGNISEFQLFS
jgi:hypothetical protein